MNNFSYRQIIWYKLPLFLFLIITTSLYSIFLLAFLITKIALFGIFPNILIIVCWLSKLIWQINKIGWKETLQDKNCFLHFIVLLVPLSDVIASPFAIYLNFNADKIAPIIYLIGTFCALGY